MKKLYLLLAASVLLCGTSMAQNARSYLMVDKATFKNDKALKATNNMQQKDGFVIWSCDFETEGTYTIVNGEGTITTWTTTSEATYPSCNGGESAGGFYVPPLNCNYEWRPEDKRWTLSETPATWMIMNAFEHYQSNLNPTADGVWGPMESTIVFSNIDLSSCQHPKLTLIQRYDVFNAAGDDMIVKTSVDGGATWTNHEVNTAADLGTNDYAKGLLEVLLPEVGGQNNVTIGIMYKNNNVYSGSYGPQCGWQVDDVKIIETPDNNLTLVEGRMSMFGYYDYRDPEILAQFSNSEDPRATAYQYCDPYGQSPRQNWVNAESEWNAYIVFNAEITNNGAATVTPKVKITVTSPSGDEIYSRTLSTTTPLAMGQTDTIDFYTEDADIFLFDVASPEQIEIGRYNVKFSVFADGAEDANPADNEKENYFVITDNNFSLAYDEPTNSFGMCNYTSSKSGDEIGVHFYYFYVPEKEMSVDVFIASGSTTGSSFKVVIYENSDDQDNPYRPLAASNTIQVTEDMIGTWQTVPFQDAYMIEEFDANYKSKSLLVSVISYYSTDDDKLYYGQSKELATQGHRCVARAGETTTWYYGYGAVAIRFHEKEETAVESVSMDDAIMYPNPTSGIVNFSNVENATIEVINMMGQVVANVENATENTTIDLSGVANGNYIVRVVKNGNVATSKLNIVK